MTTFEFQGQNFSMEGSAKTFIEKYLSRIQKYAENHAISEEVVDDLYQGIFEKLCAFEGNITQKELVDLVNSLGEPEDIFEEEETRSVIEKEKKPDDKRYEKLQKTKRTRPQDSAIFLGVCAMIGEVSGIHRWIWRIAVMILSCIFLWNDVEDLFCFWILWYLLLALIFPITDKNYNHRSTLKYGFTQIRDLRLWFKNFFFRCYELGAKVIGSSLKIVKYGFLSLWSLFLVALLISGGIVLYYLFTGFVVDKVDYSAIFPEILKIGIILGRISAFFLFLWALWSFLKKKIVKNRMIVSGIVSGIGAMIIVVICGITMYMQIKTLYRDFDNLDSLTLESRFPSQELEDLTIIRIQEPRTSGVFTHVQSLNIFESETDEIVAKYTFQFANVPWKEKVKSLITQPVIKWNSEGELLLAFPDNALFTEVVPFVPMRRDLTLYVPKNVVFHLNTDYYYATNTEKPAWMQQFGGLVQPCDKIYWKEEVGNFYCEVKPSLNAYDVENIAREKADELVPLQGLESNWSSYGYPHSQERYWSVHSVLKRGHNHYLIKFFDAFFNFFINVEFDFDEEGNLIFTDTTLEKIEQKGLMDPERMANYSGWENLSWFDLKMKETPQNPEDYEQRISALEKKIEQLEMKLWE